MISVAKYQILFWLCLIGTVFLSLAPTVGGEQLFELQDKVGHRVSMPGCSFSAPVLMGAAILLRCWH